mmetsp:Transcript_16812/g.42478  ORF Transcript_16812/g.42478 Transcript_16812/m.42478 type:complete len:81 (+) Transcript_16812:158-400(+)
MRPVMSNVCTSTLTHLSLLQLKLVISSAWACNIQAAADEATRWRGESLIPRRALSRFVHCLLDALHGLDRIILLLRDECR